PVMDCNNCLSSQVVWVELNGEAEVETFTHIVIRPTSFQQHRPYTVAVGRMKEGVKVLAWMTGFKLSEVKIGMKVKLVPKVADDGNPTYEFTPP
ncbi:MAG: OB-fold domain-containing protein, partial [Candidatus Bathyarchaeota archaeon]